MRWFDRFVPIDSFALVMTSDGDDVPRGVFFAPGLNYRQHLISLPNR
jgi:hypothetical protein